MLVHKVLTLHAPCLHRRRNLHHHQEAENRFQGYQAMFQQELLPALQFHRDLAPKVLSGCTFPRFTRSCSAHQSGARCGPMNLQSNSSGISELETAHGGSLMHMHVMGDFVCCEQGRL